MIGIDGGAPYALKAAVVFGVMMALARRGLARHHPHARIGPANQVTLVRALLAALAAGLIGEQPTTGAAWAVVMGAGILAALDGLDGWLARRTGLASAFGARFDMETDAFFILVLSVLVWQHGKAGAWVIACGLMRYVFVAAGWVLPWMARPLPPTTRGKTVAVLQVAGLSLALVPLVSPPVGTFVAATTLAALVWSFSVDVRWLARTYRQ
jgi:phosphatidylglycerophosphate synthase